jgi:hypothetical protein
MTEHHEPIGPALERQRRERKKKERQDALITLFIVVALPLSIALNVLIVWMTFRILRRICEWIF